MHRLQPGPEPARYEPRLRVRRLGSRSYDDARAIQEASAGRVAAGADDELLFVRHRPVVTVGRAGDAGQLLVSRDELRRRGVGVRDIDRGGGVTFHGPGQIVGYPIIDLRRRGVGVRGYLRGLESALVRVLRSRGIAAILRPGLTGVWTASGKVAAIGIAVRLGITRHGFALNVKDDAEAFHWIVPCGLPYPVTSLQEEGWSGTRSELMSAISSELQAALRRAGEPAAGSGCRTSMDPTRGRRSSARERWEPRANDR